MSAPTPLFLSSGDLLADRRYDRAKAFEAEGDLVAATDLLVQTLERAPGFCSAWFALGTIREKLGDAAGAVEAFRNALAAEPQDRHGAALRLARLQAGDASGAMSPAYVRALFDQYAARYDAALVEGLAYCAPAVLRDAVAMHVKACRRPLRFRRMIDLGCGTGLAAEGFRGCCESIVGVDLSPAMAEVACRKGVYDGLVVGDMVALLEREVAGACDLVIAADALVYLADLAPACRAAARVLGPDGLFAFTVETHALAGVILGEKLRYAHGTGHVRAALDSAGLRPVILTPASTRIENGAPVPGLVAVAAHR